MKSSSRPRSVVKATARAPEPKHFAPRNYHDNSMSTPAPGMSDQSTKGLPIDGSNINNNGRRRGVNVTFPVKLHVMLSQVDEEDLADVVSWQPHGRCFMIKKPREFVEKVMPKYFRLSKWTSFQRQLNLYGFRKITRGADRGSYYHAIFLRYRLSLCQNMCRTRIKGAGKKASSSPETEPDFYFMPSMTPCSDAVNKSVEMEVLSEFEEENRHEFSSLKQAGGGTIENNRFKAGTEPQKVTSVESIKYFTFMQTSIGDFPSPPVLDIVSEVQNPKQQVYDRRRMKRSTISTNAINRRPLHPVKAKGRQESLDLSRHSSRSDSEISSLRSVVQHTDIKITFEGQHFHYLSDVQENLDFSQPLIRSVSDDSSLCSKRLHPDERISFEGQHFYYLDSLALNEDELKNATTKHVKRSDTMCRQIYSDNLVIPHLVSNISDENFNRDLGNHVDITECSTLDTCFLAIESHSDDYDHPSEDTRCSGDGDDGWAIDLDEKFRLIESRKCLKCTWSTQFQIG